MDTIKDNLAIFPKGNPNNASVIFVHGFPFDHNMWNKQVEALYSTYYCVSYDIRGLGESLAGDGQTTMEMLVEDVFNIIEEEKLSKPILCGLSMGGYIALRAVEKKEEEFKALILCDTKSVADDNAARLKRAEGIAKINDYGVEEYVKDFIPNCFAEESITNLGEEYWETLKRATLFSPIGVKCCLLAMAGRTDTTPYLSEIKIPVLLLCGEKDKLISPDTMKDMAEKISGSEFHIIPGAGHISPLENPSYVNIIIEEFLSKKI
jgi:3-oxoadipate enol-lactonase